MAETDNIQNLESIPTSEDETVKKFKLSLYKSLKNLYDKWICSSTHDQFFLKDPQSEFEDTERKMKTENVYDFSYDELGSLFSNFIYVDSFYNDIGNIFPINPKSLFNIIHDVSHGASNASVYDTMFKICTDNKLLLITLPVHNNYYTSETISNIFAPNPSGLRVNPGNTFVVMYTHETSSIPTDGAIEYDSDTFDIADLTGKITPEAINGPFSRGSVNGKHIEIVVPAFGVTYGRQNQTYFTNISINSDKPKVTDASVQNMLVLANMGNTNGIIEPNTVAQDMYAIYSNQAFQCTVEMLGCMSIIPMMYFQLNNIPMFRGAYMITSVEHHIEAGKMITKFNGVRVCKSQLPYVDNVYSLAPYIESLYDKYGLNGGCIDTEGNRLDGDSSDSGNESGSNGNSGSTLTNAMAIPNYSGFDVNKALEKMKDTWYYQGTKLIKSPITQTNENWVHYFSTPMRTVSLGLCVHCVNTFIMAGLGKVGKGQGGYQSNSRNGYKYRATLSELNFGCIYSGKIKGCSTATRITKEQGFKPGDVAVMWYTDSPTSFGHAAMLWGYDNIKNIYIWVSDMAQPSMLARQTKEQYVEVWRYGVPDTSLPPDTQPSR